MHFAAMSKKVLAFADIWNNPCLLPLKINALKFYLQQNFLQRKESMNTGHKVPVTGTYTYRCKIVTSHQGDHKDKQGNTFPPCPYAGCDESASFTLKN